MLVMTGVDVLMAERMELVRGRRVGLVTNPTAVLPNMIHILEIFIEHPDIELRALFGPEHGLHSEASNGTTVESGLDPHTGLPVYSLYGERTKPTPDQLLEIDLLVFDMQDVGARFYTYATTMSYCLEAAAQAELPVLVLDRPNPINGVSVEGPVLEPGFASFVGRHPLPIRHGMTMGEMARLFNEISGFGAELTVVPMQGWRREVWFDDTGLHWVTPSPNLPTLDTAIVYPGTCLIEGANLSEGRGTTHPFEWVGAPWADGWNLARALNRLRLSGVAFRPISYLPTASKYAGQLCHGVQLHVLDRERFCPLATGLHLLKTFRDLYPQYFAWRPPREPDGVWPFDRLMGTDKVRQQMESGWPVGDIITDWRSGLLRFDELAQEYFLYG